MGTRADFYVGRGELAEWIGSIAWDGYPEGIKPTVLNALYEQRFRDAVKDFLAEQEDNGSTAPEMGWPWPWTDSRTTDYSYAFDNGKVWASCFGHAWFDPSKQMTDDDVEENEKSPKVDFPNMKEKQKVTYGPRSGLLFIVKA